MASLAPPGFVPKPVVRGGTWLQRHPTRYDFNPAVEDLIRRIYKAVPGIQICSYVDHPEGWSKQLGYDTSVLSFDAWDDAGRGAPVGHTNGQKVVNFVFSDPNPPYVDWCIWEGKIWEEETGKWRPWDDDGTGSHHDHPHFTFKPSPKGATPIPDVGSGVDQRALIALIDKHLNGMGRVILDEAKRADLHVDLACALVEQESGGFNIFGGDYGNVGDRPPFYRQPVTRERVQALRTGGSYRYGMNGVGLTQLTWWEFVEKAEKMGGAHLPAIQCRVGFTDLVSMLDYEGFGYLEALGAYNAGRGSYQVGIDNGYAGSVASRHRAWKQLISSLPKAAPAPKPVPAPQKPVEPPASPPAPIDLSGRVDKLERRVEALEKPVSAQPAPNAPPNFDVPPSHPVLEPPEWVNPAPVKEEPMPERQTPAKAIAAALVPLATALALYVSTGEVDTEEVSLAVAALVSGLLVYLTSNRPKPRDPNARG